MKVITVRGTPHYDHALTYQISLTYLERRANKVKGSKQDSQYWLRLHMPEGD
jgi:hypothetical protein